MNRLRAFVVVGLTLTFSSTSFAKGSDETVIVSKPGTLSELVLDLESSRIASLKVVGELSAPDIAYLREGTGKLTNVAKLDLSQVTLVAGEEPYATVQIASSDVGMGKTTATFFISETYRIETSTSATSLGGTNITQKIWCDDLAGAFAITKASDARPPYTEIILPKYLTKVGNYTFFGNTNIENVGLPENAKVIGTYSFGGASKLTGFTLTDKIETIEDGAFSGTGLTELVLPRSLSKIGKEAFSNSKLTCSLDFSHVAEIGEAAFRYVKLTGELNLQGLKEIPNYAFQYGEYCSVQFSDKLESIGSGAFERSNITNVLLPSSLKTLDRTSFIGTPWMESLINSNEIIYVNDIALTPGKNYKPADGVLTIKEGTRAIASGNWKHASWPNGDYLYKLVNHIELPSSLKEIGEGVFESFSLIGDTELPVGLECIGASAFENCSNLWFEDLPESMVRIGDRAFSNCPKLTQITLGESIESVGTSAFSACTGISTVKVYAEELVDSDWIGFGNVGLDRVTIGNKVRILPDGMFTGASNLRKVEFIEREPGISLYVGTSCFSGATKAQFINFPQKLDYVGNDAFENCQLSIPSLDLSDCTYIGDHAFRDTHGPETILLPANLEYLGVGAFENWEELTAIIYNCRNARPGSSAFSGCNSVTSVKIGPEVSYIGWSLFSLPSIEEVVFEKSDNLPTPTSLTIDGWAFGNSKIKEISLPEYTTTIETYAFAYLKEMKELTLPASVESLGRYVITESSISNIYCYAQNPPSLKDKLREDNKKVTVHVPETSEDLYKVAPYWCYYDVVPMPATSTGSLDDISPAIRVSGNEITIDGIPADSILTVYTLDGRLAGQSSSGHIGGLPQGLYIAKYGEMIEKLWIK